MLKNADKKDCDYLPHEQAYRRRRDRLPAGLADEIARLIHEYCDGKREVTAGRLFGVEGFPDLHQRMVAALNDDEEEANQLLGQMLWQDLRQRQGEIWCFYRPENEGDIIPPAMRYWRPDEGAL